MWAGPPIAAAAAENFRTAVRDEHVRATAVHHGYLANLGSPKPATLARSRIAFRDEVARAELLAVDGLVFHPGAHTGSGVELGLKAVAESLRKAIEERPRGPGPPAARERRGPGDHALLEVRGARRRACGRGRARAPRDHARHLSPVRGRLGFSNGGRIRAPRGPSARYGRGARSARVPPERCEGRARVPLGPPREHREGPDRARRVPAPPPRLPLELDRRVLSRPPSTRTGGTLGTRRTFPRSGRFSRHRLPLRRGPSPPANPTHALNHQIARPTSRRRRWGTRSRLASSSPSRRRPGRSGATSSG